MNWHHEFPGLGCWLYTTPQTPDLKLCLALHTDDLLEFVDDLCVNLRAMMDERMQGVTELLARWAKDKPKLELEAAICGIRLSCKCIPSVLHPRDGADLYQVFKVRIGETGECGELSVSTSKASVCAAESTEAIDCLTITDPHSNVCVLFKPSSDS